MCKCSCHVEGFLICSDCDHLHTAEERAIGPMASPPSETPAPAHEAAPQTTTVDGTHDAAFPNHAVREVQKDGTAIGGCDHDQPYQFGRKPTVKWTHPFNESQFARLLVVRSRLGDGRLDLRHRKPSKEEA